MSWARPSELMRMRWGWSQPRTRPCRCAAAAASASGSTIRAAVIGRSIPSARTSARLRPPVHSLTAAPSTSAGRAAPPGARTSSSRAAPRCSKLPVRSARTIISPARAVPSGSSDSGSVASRRKRVTATSRRRTVSSASQNSAPAAGSVPSFSVRR
ncbi:hypothetical protein ACFQV8_38280 [Pseudonocardia benzenivorans]